MKKEVLLELGLSEEQAAKVFELNGKDIEAAKAKFGDYETVKRQFSEANKTIEGFQAMDIDGVGSKAQVEVNCGFRVTNSKLARVRKSTRTAA